MEHQITPADFLSETPPPRIIGSECEYNIQIPQDEEKPIYLNSYISHYAIERAGYQHINSYLNNGARLYTDVGHLEYATPESLGPRQAAAADIAGMYVLRRIVSTSKVPHNGMYRIAGVGMPKQRYGTPASGHTNGYHENYMLPRQVAESELAREVLPTFFASRVWSMGGAAQAHGYGLSQKIVGIGGEPVNYTLDRRTSSGEKPMVMIPIADYDEDVIGAQEWARIELRYADPGMSPIAKYAGFAATSLVLRLIEHADKLPKKALQRMTLEDPVGAARTFAYDPSFSVTSYTAYEKQVNVLDLGDYYVGLATKLAGKIELPEDEVAAIGLWSEILHRMSDSSFDEGEYAGLEVMLDIAAKHRYILGHTDNMKRTNPLAVRHSLAWDRIAPTGAGMIWWEKVPQQWVTDDEINALMFQPPRTRAEERATLITYQSDIVENINWAQIRYKNEAWWNLCGPYGK